MSEPEHTFYLETFGCQMSEHDSERIAGVLASAGWVRVETPGEAELLLINTCAVREKPEHKVYSRLGELRKGAKPSVRPVLGLCGCVAQIRGEHLLRDLPHLDLVIGTGAIHTLPELVQQAFEGQRSARLEFDHHHEELWRAAERSGPPSAYVSIIHGCNNWCAYCVVPAARGPEVSRPLSEVVEEVRSLVDQGYVEVTLLGQNVNSYAQDLAASYDFPDLLAALNEIEGLRRIRFTTSHPKDVPDRLIEAMGSLEKVCEHFHLAVQAGDDEVLRRMRRRYTAAQFIELTDKLRAGAPGLSITTDVMVGFPGETPEQFERTLELFRRVRFDQAFMFEYSDRPGTAAAELEPKIPKPEKNRRLRELAALQNTTSREINAALVGQSFEVLVTGASPKDPARLMGRTRQNKTMIFEGPAELVGGFAQVTARKAFLWGFTGELDG